MMDIADRVRVSPFSEHGFSLSEVDVKIDVALRERRARSFKAGSAETRTVKSRSAFDVKRQRSNARRMALRAPGGGRDRQPEPQRAVEPWLSSCRAVEAPSRRCRACCRGLHASCRALSSLSRLTPCAGASSSVEVCRGLSSSCRAVELSSNVELMNSCLAVEPAKVTYYRVFKTYC